MSDTVQSECHQLEIESGRCKKKTASKRSCKFCYLNTVEDEVPFYVFFSAYDYERQRFFSLLLAELILSELSIIHPNKFGSCCVRMIL